MWFHVHSKCQSLQLLLSTIVFFQFHMWYCKYAHSHLSYWFHLQLLDARREQMIKDTQIKMQQMPCRRPGLVVLWMEKFTFVPFQQFPGIKKGLKSPKEFLQNIQDTVISYLQFYCLKKKNLIFLCKPSLLLVQR